ncbi:7-keto-8-aminopelargonate synthetase-like enzyme [Pontibacter aydingkolensis]|uniref:Aminotransferase class I/II-fold pyridoxal phosphate-dependent enzyme n=1 Tax=Pontibacter aydingkolensis TaxID=1911536 RepID=A0ABS7CVY3_9BACT|nr:aminotransferase class I/II-fold pyridoxal phosphate-dependent enzyme [Pontibacter aydingkolensis]MBW7467923.1 aminotransferase class I/II-fold pyridoxal phosphate-dependent enzyme [Pontibacter aydingkolensis]
MAVVEAFTGRTVIVNGKERLYFSGTSYLGMSKNSRLEALIHAGGKRYGTTYSSSRGSNLKLAVYDEAESMLASHAGAEGALTFSSGYLAGQALIRTLDTGQSFIYAPDAHPAVWRTAADANHTDYTSWVEALPSAIAACSGDVVLVMNSVDPLYARKYAFNWITDLPEDKQITLIVDDSHGFGLLGEKGAGVYPELRKLLKLNVELVVVASMGKALGIAGGVVLGSTGLIGSLKKSPYFMGGSPAPPAYLYAYLHAQKVYEQARQQLTRNVLHFQQMISDTGLFNFFDTYPVFYTKHHGLTSALEDDIIISCFPYPDPDSEPITRVVINSLHTFDDIEFLAGKIEQYRVGVK